jgi:beta-lactamase regulating signal transducer with metallopeptidase domain
MDTLLHTGLTNAVLATVLAVAVAGVGLVCRRPALLHSLWLLVLLKLLTPPLVPVPLPWPGGSAPDAEPAAPEPAVRQAVARPIEAPRPVPPQAAETASGTRSRRADAGAVPSPQTAAEPASAPTRPMWPVVLGTVWLAGCLGWWAVAGYRVRRFQKLLRHAVPAPPAVHEQAQRLAARLGLARCPRVDLVPAPVSPLLWALGRAPRLLLPAALWERLTPDQQQTLLAHELAHLRRRDHWVRWLELMVFGLYWWHPVVWWASHRLREAEEQCCDAWVVWALPATAPAYAAALVETMAFLSQARPALPQAASGAGHVQTLKRRLNMILHEPSPRALSRAGFLAVFGLGALLLPLLPTQAQSPAREAPRDRATADRERPEQPAAGDRPVARTPANGRTREGGGERPVTGDRTRRTTPPWANRSGVSEQVETLKDDIELLEVQLEAKAAELLEAEVLYKQAHEHLARLDKLGKQAVGSEDLSKARAEVEVRQARLAGKKAQLREVQVRLSQAKRRLAGLQKLTGEKPATSGGRDSRPATGGGERRSDRPATNPSRERTGRGTDRPERDPRDPNAVRPAVSRDKLAELERKLEALMREVEALRKAVGRPEPRPRTEPEHRSR